MMDEELRSAQAQLQIRRAGDSIVSWPGWTFVIIGGLLVFAVLSKVPLP